MFRRLETDRWLFLSTVALCLVGAVMVFSASAVTAREQYGHAYYFLLRQLVWLVLGAGGMLLLMNIDYRVFRKPTVVFAGLGSVLLMLVAVFFLDKRHETHRWISIGSFGLQPAELAKLAVIAYLAWFLDRRMRAGGNSMNDLRHTIGPALIPVIVVVGLIAKQPDLGTAIEIFLIALAMLFVAGVSMKYIVAAGALVSPYVLYLVIFVPWRLRTNHQLSPPQRGSAGQRIPVDSVADRRGFRRTYRRRPHGKQTEAFLFAGGAHRFYFCRFV